ncbi:MAG: SAM-dependent methyltransferase [Tindallia sp. MSAO_Bac2]|nr:MAG: SAM-dependent methyltransferase [Tindallia sp. MSAO_Bac2]
MVKLPVRLDAIAAMISPVKSIADIGTDHGLLPVYLLQTGKTEYAIVSDINKGPLEKARKTAHLHCVESVMDFRLGNGLEVLRPNEASVIIMAGMGGLLINSLLDNSTKVINSVDYLILQPMQAVSEVRKYLLKNGYRVYVDRLVKEKNHFYHIIKVKYENLPATGIGSLEAMIGIQWKKQSPEIFCEYVNELLNRFSEKKSGLMKSKHVDKKHLERTDKQIRELEEVIEWLRK